MKLRPPGTMELNPEGPVVCSRPPRNLGCEPVKVLESFWKVLLPKRRPPNASVCLCVCIGSCHGDTAAQGNDQINVNAANEAAPMPWRSASSVLTRYHMPPPANEETHKRRLRR